MDYPIILVEVGPTETRDSVSKWICSRDVKEILNKVDITAGKYVMRIIIVSEDLKPWRYERWVPVRDTAKVATFDCMRVKFGAVGFVDMGIRHTE